MDEFRLVERPPTVAEYQRLQEAVGWDVLDAEAVARGLGNSLFSVCVTFNGDVIGCGRVIGDGGMYFYIQDIIVAPEFQGKGIGRRIMETVMGYIRSHAHPNAFISLMATEGVASFYQRYNFREMPPEMPGMFQRWGQ